MQEKKKLHDSSGLRSQSINLSKKMWKILTKTSWLGKKYLLISSPLLLAKFDQPLHTFLEAQVSLMFLQKLLQWQVSAPKSGLQNLVLFGFRHILKFLLIDNRHLFYYFQLLTLVVYIQFRYIACVFFLFEMKKNLIQKLNGLLFAYLNVDML